MGTILLVDDDQDTVDLYALVLMSKGHQVLCATSIPKAVELAYTKRVDVLVTDLFLGDGMGTDIMRLLSKRAPKAGILITGRDPHPARRYPGFEDYLVKPCEPGLLCKTVENCLALLKDDAA